MLCHTHNIATDRMTSRLEKGGSLVFEDSTLGIDRCTSAEVSDPAREPEKGAGNESREWT